MKRKPSYREQLEQLGAEYSRIPQADHEQRRSVGKDIRRLQDERRIAYEMRADEGAAYQRGPAGNGVA